MNQKKILIVEDEVIPAMYMRQQLQKHNYYVIKPVGTGEKAINVAISEHPDIILMDIGLASKINGIEAAKEILSFSKPLIIFMTGYHNDDFIAEAKILNAPFMVKPIDVTDVIQVIESGEMEFK